MTIRVLLRINAVADNSIDLYRSMRLANDGLPDLGDNARTLGARQYDILISLDGLVYPDTGGMSVSPNSAMNIHPVRRPQEFDGYGKDPIWKISLSDIGCHLAYRADPKNSRHGFIEPKYPMPFKLYQQAIWETRSKWIIVTHPE